MMGLAAAEQARDQPATAGVVIRPSIVATLIVVSRRRGTFVAAALQLLNASAERWRSFAISMPIGLS